MNVNKDLLLGSYNFDLPKDRIADRPVEGRHNSKLLVYNVKDDSITHTTFKEVHEFMPKDSLLVLNQTKVFPCRLFGNKISGGKCEVFILSLVPDEYGYKVLIKASGKKKIGDIYKFSLELESEISHSYNDGTFAVKFNVKELESTLHQIGKIPIPPYIRGGESDESDLLDYQTVYAKDTGSVAAPTAGLHFTNDVFDSLSSKNIDKAYVTLHVGLGTFAPVKEDNLKDHKMHSEKYFVTSSNLEKIRSAKKVFCVGTTSLRVLESSINENGDYNILPNKIYDTEIFLHPGVEVKSIDGLITNFHLPKSTLLMLVSSLIGRDKTLELYNEAVRMNYRFFSYGDAMLILR